MPVVTLRKTKKVSRRSRDKRLWERKMKKLSTNDPSLAEILKVVQISQETQDVDRRWTDKNRRVINSKDLRDEVHVIQRGNSS
jgi:hypothetical protein